MGEGLVNVKLDSDDSGLVSYSEFSAFVNEGTGGHSQRNARSALLKAVLRKIKRAAGRRGADLRAPFTKFDADGNGFLDKDEFEYAIRDLGVFLSEKELNTLFYFFDGDKNGKIEYGEFLFAFFNRRAIVKQWEKQSGRHKFLDHLEAKRR